MTIIDIIGWEWVILIAIIIIIILWLIWGGTKVSQDSKSPPLDIDIRNVVTSMRRDNRERPPSRANFRASEQIFTKLQKHREIVSSTGQESEPTTYINTNGSIIHGDPSTEITITNPVSKDIREPAGFVSKMEELTCRTMEEIFKGYRFSKIRPNFLKNPETGRNLEIDCYNEELKIGVEYNGIQHYKWPNFTSQTEDEFILQYRRDQYKVKTCDENGVYLIRVPYYIKANYLKEYLLQYLPSEYFPEVSV